MRLKKTIKIKQNKKWYCRKPLKKLNKCEWKSKWRSKQLPGKKRDSLKSSFSIRRVYLSLPGVAFSLLRHNARWITDTSRSTQPVHTVNSRTHRCWQVPCLRGFSFLSGVCDVVHSECIYCASARPVTRTEALHTGPQWKANLCHSNILLLWHREVISPAEGGGDWGVMCADCWCSGPC